MNTIIDPAFEFISQFENVKKTEYTAFWDVSRYSIGFGTISFAGEKISYDEAVRRSKEFLNTHYDNLMRYAWFKALSSARKIAVMSYSYQYGIAGFLRQPAGMLVSTGKDPYEVWRTSAYQTRRVKEADLWKQDPVIIKNMDGNTVVWIGLGILAFFFISK
jgi:GH24 family phage-related lysozyme (muramidase)